MHKSCFIFLYLFLACYGLQINVLDFVAAKSCPEGWVFYNSTGACYKIVGSPSTWSDAEDSCKAEDSHLASIHSQEEGIFVAGLNNAINPCDWTQNAWIGHYTEDNNAHWHWTDGSNFDYSNWYPSEPDQPGLQNCGLLQSGPCSKTCFRAGDFQNCPCSAKLPKFVCKKLAS